MYSASAHQLVFVASDLQTKLQLGQGNSECDERQFETMVR